MPDATSYDVIVVGMGPGGSTAAARLSRAGFSVLGIDKQRHPRYKVCGGGLSARIDRLVDADFRAVVEQTVCGVQFTCAGEPAFFIESPSPVAYMVMRDRFDRLLLDQARRAGTVVHEEETVVSLIQSDDRVTVDTDGGRYHARAVIGADGANSVVARQLFPRRRGRLVPGLESEVATDGAPQFLDAGRAVIDIGVTQKGYAWIFPKAGRLSVGAAEFRGKPASPKGTLERFIRGTKGLASLPIPQPIGHPLPLYPLWGRRSGDELVRHRALLVGDAGHLVDPLFGEGIYYAVRSGQLAADAVAGAFQERHRLFGDYDAAIQREMGAEFRIAGKMAHVVYSFPRISHRILSHDPDIVRLYYGVLQGTETYQSFYVKASGRVKSALHRMLREQISFG
jgi:geranylgeranyl reductase family protein